MTHQVRCTLENVLVAPVSQTMMWSIGILAYHYKQEDDQGDYLHQWYLPHTLADDLFDNAKNMLDTDPTRKPHLQALAALCLEALRLGCNWLILEDESLTRRLGERLDYVAQMIGEFPTQENEGAR